MITLDTDQATGVVVAAGAVFMLAVGVAHQLGVLEATPAHEACDQCGTPTCECDPQLLEPCPGTVVRGCFHHRVLCTACMLACRSCRDDVAVDAYFWGADR